MRKTVCGIFLILFIFGFAECSYGYSDISEEYWGYEAVNELSEKGILSGYPDGTFRPDNNMTRAEFLTILIRITEPNTDVSCGLGHWAEGSVKLAEEKNIIFKSEYGNFDPDKNITRREICLMLYRSIKELKDIDTAKLTDKKIFSDISENNKEEEKITAILSHLGVLTGYPDGSAGLNEFSSRAETCCFINNFLKCRCILISVINDNEITIYEDDIATAEISELPFSLKKQRYSEDMPYATTIIKNVAIFPFNEPDEKYKNIFEEINNSEDIYLRYRKKFGDQKYVIAVEFETSNNTSECEIYAGAEFLHIFFPEEEICVIDAFDTAEIERQLNKNAGVGQLVRPGESLDTSAFYVVDALPKNKIRFDRSITALYNMKKKQTLPAASFHSLVVDLESR